TVTERPDGVDCRGRSPSSPRSPCSRSSCGRSRRSRCRRLSSSLTRERMRCSAAVSGVRPAWTPAAALTLALSSLAYAATIVAEAIFLPLAALASWLAVRALVSLLRRNQLLLAATLVAGG